MSILLDTSAWIELFRGTEKGKRVESALSIEKCYTSMSTLCEIVNWALKEKLEPNRFIGIIEKISLVLRLDREIVILAGRLNFERKKINKNWGMLDSFILATGLLYNLKIVTKDSDFRDLTRVEVL